MLLKNIFNLTTGTLSDHARKSDQNGTNDNESSLLLNQLAEQHQMTTANARMFILSSSPQPFESNQQATAHHGLREISRAASTTSTIQMHNQYNSNHIQIRSPSSTSILGMGKQLQNRLSGTEV